MLDGRRPVARPWQAEVFAGKVVPRLRVLAATGFQRAHVENVHVAHVGLQSLGRLARIADGPATGIEFASDVLDIRLFHASLGLCELDVLPPLPLAEKL